MTVFGSLEPPVGAIRAWAYDFVAKPVEMDMQALTLERAVKHSALQEKLNILNEAFERTKKFDELLGASV